MPLENKTAVVEGQWCPQCTVAHGMKPGKLVKFIANVLQKV